MAYISKEEVAKIRELVKKAFPEYKFSITKEHSSSVTIALLEADIDAPGYEQLNQYYLDRYSDDINKIFTTIKNIVNGVKEHIDRNAGDPFADYCNCNYYYNLHIGKWDKPYVKKIKGGVNV